MQNKADLVLGIQWGDEGKGKVVDCLSGGYDAVCRCGGGHNAGHTIVAGGRKYALHLLPSGVLSPATLNVIGNGVVVSPAALCEEMRQFGDLRGRLFVSDRAHLNLPHHAQIDRAKETLRGASAVGTTGKGIGPCYADKIARNGHRVGELLNPRKLAADIARDFAQNRAWLAALGVELPSESELFATLREQSEILAPFIADTTRLVWGLLDGGKRVLIEGAQGTMLDIDHGTYPFVTSSNTIAAGACAGLGLSPKQLGKVIGIIKAYTTRVGNGAFVSEEFGADGERLCEVGREYGTTTGRRRRCGWFDAVAVRYAARLNGVDEFALTKLDVLDGFEQVKICVGYERDGSCGGGDVGGAGGAESVNFGGADGANSNLAGTDGSFGGGADSATKREIIDFVPTSLDGLRPVYEVLDGWESLGGATTLEAMPPAAQKFVARIEELTGTRIGIISTAPEREATIIR